MRLIAILAITGLLTACASGNTVIKNEPTQGQQLLDLKRAHEAGAMSDSEYEKARADVLDD